jgi:glycerol-3-phosphate acyltransferase PlsX
VSKDIVIAVDVMGGDHGPSVVVPGAVDAAREAGLSLALVGDESSVYAELEKLNCSDITINVVHATQVAETLDKPSDVLRRKKDASIQVACRLVREGSAHGLVSPGNSGATVACGMFVVGRIDGVDRPALASFMPTENDPMVLLDVGATVDCKPHNLFQFGLMGDAVAKGLLGIEKPGIGLLSIGEEEGKGNAQVKEAYELFKMAHDFNFLGNVEGRDVFTGQIDVVVCDGFVGNVVLKLSEGLASSLARLLKRELLSAGPIAKLGTFLAKGALKRFARFVDHTEYGGAPLLGLKGITMVCHGSSNQRAIHAAVKQAGMFVEKKTNQMLVESISAYEELTRYSSAAQVI